MLSVFLYFQFTDKRKIYWLMLEVLKIKDVVYHTMESVVQFQNWNLGKEYIVSTNTACFVSVSPISEAPLASRRNAFGPLTWERRQ